MKTLNCFREFEGVKEGMCSRNIKLSQLLMERHCLQKANLFVSNLFTLLSCFDGTLLMHEVVLSFTVIF